MNEEGQMTVFAIGVVLICLAVVGLAADGTRVFLARRALQNAADAAALAGASELDRVAYRSSDGSKVVSGSDARAVAGSALQRRSFEGRAHVEIEASGIYVALALEVDTFFLRLLGVDSMPVSAEARATPVAGSIP